MCAAVAMLAAFLAESEARWLRLGLAAVFLHSPILLLACNTARMEPLVLRVATGSLLLESGGGIPGELSRALQLRPLRAHS
jgi:hypothetical protein